ncbi:MAG: hypothetical protein ACTSSJ_00500 [Candidatus Odinarchaeia archaeon]
MSKSNDFTFFEIETAQIPSTIIGCLGLSPPENIDQPVKEIQDKFKGERIILALFDTLSLFECVYYKPQFLIKTFQVVTLLKDHKSDLKTIVNKLIHDSSEEFDLLKFLAHNKKKCKVIGRKEILEGVSSNSEICFTPEDMKTYIETVKSLNRYDFLMICFSDFNYVKDKYKGGVSEEIAKKIIARTDKWILTLHKQMRDNTILIVLGTGDTFISYEGKYGEWKNASVPIAIFIKR